MGNATQSRQTLTLKDHLDFLYPSDKEFEAIFQGAVSISAYKPMRGGRSHFPAPVDFIDTLFGDPDETAPVWDDEWDKNRSTKLLRATWSLKRYLDKHKNAMWAVRTKINCPICDKETMDTTLGFGLSLDWDMWKDHSVSIDQKSMRLLALNIRCQCDGYTVNDFALIEELAKENAVSNIRR